MPSKAAESPYVLWLDYGSEGWQPKGFEIPDEVLEAIAEGYTHGMPFVITRRLDLVLKPYEPTGDTK